MTAPADKPAGDEPAGDRPAPNHPATDDPASGDLAAEDPRAVAVVDAIRTGDVARLRHLLTLHRGLARTGVVDGSGTRRSLLHVATDWPGHFPRVADTVRILVEGGADVDVRLRGANAETPLHWAASSGDVAALDALLDAGADLEADGAVIAGGTPLSDAVAFGQWNTARRLVERGAETPLREAAALGLTDRVEALLNGAPGPPGPDELNQVLWYACHGGQLEVARYLLGRGADPHWRAPWDQLSCLEAARRSQADDVAAWLVDPVGGPEPASG